jgi:hypothetical protein
MQTRINRIGLFLFAVLIGAQGWNGSSAQGFGKDSFSMAIDKWAKSEEVSISPSAHDLIVSTFNENKGRLKDYGGDVVWKGGTRTLNQTLVLYYLSDLRDLKAAKKSGVFSTPASMSQNPNKGGEQGITTEWKTSELVMSDVEAYTVEEFIKEVEPVLKGKKGELHTISKPPGAAIILDKTRRGFTEKISIEEAGEHRISVVGRGLSCSQTVIVPEGGSVTFQCP